MTKNSKSNGKPFVARDMLANTEHKPTGDALGLLPPPLEEASLLGVDDRVRKLCDRIGAPYECGTSAGAWILRWAHIGVQLAMDEPEFKGADRSRGRKRGWTAYPDDQKILKVIRDVTAETGLDDQTVTNAVIRRLEKDGKLDPSLDRTSHRKRLKRKLLDQKSSRPGLLAAALLSRDNK